MAHRPGKDIENYLDAHSTALTANVNLFHGSPRPADARTGVPVECVFVIAERGRAPDRVLGTAMQISHPHISIIVRSDGFTSGQNLAWAVNDALQSASPETELGFLIPWQPGDVPLQNVYMDLRMLQTQPNFLDRDKNNHYFWSVNLEAMYQTM